MFFYNWAVLHNAMGYYVQKNFDATAMGLLVAIPATIGYNTFHGSLGVLETRLVNFAGMFLNRVQRELNAHRPVSRSGQAE